MSLAIVSGIFTGDLLASYRPTGADGGFGDRGGHEIKCTVAIWA